MMTPASAGDSLTRSVEDYLKAIYRLTLEGQPAATSEIAQQLEISAPSVSGMVKRLSEQGLLRHVPYKGVELTPEGRRAALRMLRHHRIIETYLVAYLGYTWDTVHAEAERLEHVVSETLVDRMAAALGDPDFDPHGDPIPSADGSMPEQRYASLAELPVGSSSEIRRVATSDDDRLRFIASLGLVPGVPVRVTARQPFNGPVTVRSGEAEIMVGHEIAGLLLCEPPEA